MRFAPFSSSMRCTWLLLAIGGLATSACAGSVSDGSAGASGASGGSGGSGATTGGGSSGVISDSGLTNDAEASACPSSTPPDCNSLPDSERCAPDWASALTRFSKCQWGTTSTPYLAECGTYHAIVTLIYDGTFRYFYDGTGRLIGGDFSSSPPDLHQCSSYWGSFGEPDCLAVPLAGICLPDGAVPPDASSDAP